MYIMYSTGATVISELLMDNCMIKVLGMDNNNIGDNGITAIAKALTNSGIRVLEINNCGITLTGAGSIATFLLLNQSVRELWLLDNLLTTEGAHLILQSAVNNKACQVLTLIDDEYKNDAVQSMMTILVDRRRMTTNVVGYVVYCISTVVIRN